MLAVVEKKLSAAAWEHTLRGFGKLVSWPLRKLKVDFTPSIYPNEISTYVLTIIAHIGKTQG